MTGAEISLTTAAGESFTVSLADTRAAREFTALLPLTLTLTDYNATEKIADLPKRLSTDGAPEGHSPAPGDFAYYAPWGNLAVFYKSFRHSPGLVNLGRLGRIPDALRSRDPVVLKIELIK